MPITSFALVVLAAITHATWNLLAKRAASVGAPFVFAYNLVSCIAYAPWALWLVAKGALPLGWPVLICIAASGLIHLAYSLTLQRGYQLADLSVVYPVARGTGPMLSAMGAFLLLGERPSYLRIAGLLAVVAGIALIATDGRLNGFARPAARDGVRWGGATGALIAGYTIVDAWGVKALLIPPVVLDWCANSLRFVLLAPAIMRNRRVATQAMRGYWPLAFGVGLLSPIGYILVLGALSLGAPLSIVAPAREMSMMVGALFGMLLLRERVGPARLAGCAVMVAGVLLLGAS
ncbi:EamA family transporter [Sphingomonas tabacisoli]|uniref:EamA family transporter n=1 Tax=Sphingomonas tabacisoli TaxID=2249466 RepID=A0ABW4HZK8_9SPHN